MKASTITLAIIATYVSAASANMHHYGWCFDKSLKPVKGGVPVEEETPNDEATKSACTAYKNVKTGSSNDQCPDCTPGMRGSATVCNSSSKRIAGNQWGNHCRDAGADGSHGS